MFYYPAEAIEEARRRLEATPSTSARRPPPPPQPQPPPPPPPPFVAAGLPKYIHVGGSVLWGTEIGRDTAAYADTAARAGVYDRVSSSLWLKDHGEVVSGVQELPLAAQERLRGTWPEVHEFGSDAGSALSLWCLRPIPHVNSDSNSNSNSDSDSNSNSNSDSYSDSDSSSGSGSGGGDGVQENDQMQVPASPFAEEQGMSTQARGQSAQAQATNSPQSLKGTETALDLASRYGGIRISLEWRVPAGGSQTEPVKYTFKRRLGMLGPPIAGGNVFSVIWDDPAAFARTQFMMYFTRETDASEERNPFVALGWRSDDRNSIGLLLFKKRQGYNAVKGLTDDEARRLGIGMDGLTMMNSYDARDA